MIDLTALTECDRMVISPKTITRLHEKDGISLFEVENADGARYVLKLFENQAYRREISHYAQLQSVGVPTIPVIASTEKALLMEDLRYSDTWRLGVKEDMQSAAVAEALAPWYQKLHIRGKTLANDPTRSWYSELDFFTREGLAKLQTRTQTQDAILWRLLDRVFDPLHAQIQAIPKTLTYNDFYYVNLAVSRDGKEALMFDYNFLGLGYLSMDTRNVCSSLSPESGEAFLAAYGPLDPQEVLIDEIVSPLTTLVMGAQRKKLPSWFDDVWEEVQSDIFLEKIMRVDQIQHNPAPNNAAR